ncbi:MAG: hypothetical protein QNJ54_07900 [Prochloraceae cyanobacterium]|nr:hypothetical protein [Prochloraceae cyanobacterium]
MTFSPSQIQDKQLENIIKNCNPFDREVIVTKQAIWKESFPDVPSINAAASDAVFKAIDNVSNGHRKVIGITHRAERGVGKSHIISRIRSHIKTEGNAFFVYMGEYSDLDKIKLEFLNILCASLKQEGFQGVMQWQELAAALVNEALDKKYNLQTILEVFPNWFKQTKHNLVNQLTQQILEIKSDIEDPDLITAIVCTLHPTYKAFAIKWLSGKSLTTSKAEEMGLPNPSEEEREAECFSKICQILDVISNYKTIVICFDELDSTDYSESGFTRAQIVASFIKDLYNNIKRGVFLTSMYPQTWSNHINSLPQAEAVVDRIGSHIIDLKYLNSNDVLTLVSCYLKEFYTEQGLTPPHSVYPFTETQLRTLGTERPTVRKVLNWCKDKWRSGPIIDPRKLAYNNELQNIEADFMEDKAKLAKAMIFAFNRIIGQKVEGVQVEKIETILEPYNEYINFKIIGKEKGKTVKIGVAIMQSSNGNRIGACLRHLSQYQIYDLTRGCLVRSTRINPTSRVARQRLNVLLNEKRGAWVLLKEEQVRPLIAIYAVYSARENYELSDREIFEFISQKKLALDNPLLKEILSNTCGKIPENADDEDIVYGS